MRKEANYPIQYAVLELKKSGGYSVGYKDITQGFIVSKCYVVESNIIYDFDGRNKIVHKVMFPFKDISCLEVSLRNDSQDIGEENIPSYVTCNDSYLINEVTELFDSYEKAKMIAEEENEKLRRNVILQQEFEQRLKLCNLFERLVLEATEDMNISEQLSIDKQESPVKILKPVKKSYIKKNIGNQ